MKITLMLAASLFATLIYMTWRSYQREDSPLLLGDIETVSEATTGMRFKARIDTGAETCSIHSESLEIVHPSPDPHENVGKRVRFLVRNKRGQTDWLEAVIVAYIAVRTSEQVDGRYKVPLTLSCRGIEKTVLVTLNDREEMRYSMLIGRNFLRNDFIVDVAMND